MRTLLVFGVAVVIVVALANRPTSKKSPASLNAPSIDLKRFQRGGKQRAIWEAKGVDLQSPEFNTNIIYGEPVITQDWSSGEVKVVSHQSYTSRMSKNRRSPAWVCHRIQAKHIAPTQREGLGFSLDNSFDLDWQARSTDYRYSGYDIGHLASAGDFGANADFLAETFKFTNAAPQVGLGFNQERWAYLEDWCRKQALKAYGQVCWAITGGYFATKSWSATAGGQATNPRKFIGTNRIPVPTHFFKILVSVDRNGRPSAIAFAMENREHDNGSTKYPDF